MRKKVRCNQTEKKRKDGMKIVRERWREELNEREESCSDWRAERE